MSALTACAPAPPPRCDLTVARDVRFSAADAPDHVEARALGARCNAAVATLILRDPEGAPIWAWAAPFYPTFGDRFAPHAAASREDVETFLTRWIALAPARTRAAPPWSEDIDTTLEQATYEDIRARDLPMLCHLVAVAREQCVYWEPAAAVAAALYARSVGPPPPPPLEPGETSDRR